MSFLMKPFRLTDKKFYTIINYNLHLSVEVYPSNLLLQNIKSNFLKKSILGMDYSRLYCYVESFPYIMMAANPNTPTIKTISGPEALVVAGGRLVGDAVMGAVGGAVVRITGVAAVVKSVVATVAGRVVLKTLVWVGETDEVMSGFELRIWTLPVWGVIVLPSTG